MTIWSELDDIPWGEIRQAHGTAEDIPQAIRALATASPDRVEDAYWRLDNHVVLQGTVYEAAYSVIPYMLEIIESGRPAENRAAAYDLLVEIARGEPADPDGGPLLDACVERIAAKRARYEADLREGDPRVRIKALDLLTSIRLIDDEARLRALLTGLEASGELAERIAEELRDLH
jgi:hypothetical protein